MAGNPENTDTATEETVDEKGTTYESTSLIETETYGGAL